MVAAHSQPTFSVVERLEVPSVLDRLGGRLLELRLLAVGPASRNSMVFAGLGRVLVRFARSPGYTHVVISGFSTQNRTANCAISTPLLAQCSAARRHAARKSGPA